MAYTQKNNPFPITSCGRRRTGGIANGFSSPLKHENPKGVYHNDRQPNPGNPKGQLNPSHQHTKGNTSKLGTDKKGRTSDSSPLDKRRKRKKSNEPRKTTKGKGRNFRTTKEGAGMTAKGVKAYRRKNPGSKLKTAVTGKVKPGSKAAKRRKSFCARSKGWTGKRGKAARRRWKC